MKQLVNDRRMRWAVLAAILFVSLVAGFAATPAEARPPCFAYCHPSGYLYACCPTGQGTYECGLTSYPC